MDEHKRQALGGPRRTALPRSPIGDFGRVTQVEVTEGRGTG
jgi:hypothetical protein